MAADKGTHEMLMLYFEQSDALHSRPPQQGAPALMGSTTECNGSVRERHGLPLEDRDLSQIFLHSNQPSASVGDGLPTLSGLAAVSEARLEERIEDLRREFYAEIQKLRTEGRVSTEKIGTKFDSTPVLIGNTMVEETYDTVTGPQSNYEVTTPQTENTLGSQTTVHIHESDALDHVIDYSFCESVWDSSILIGVRGIRPIVSASMLIVLLITMAIQTLMWFLIREYVDEDPLPDDLIDNLIRWRQSEAHAFSNVDSLTSVGLASRVCGGDQALSIATYQMTLYGDLKLYQRAVWGTPSGPLLCTVAIFIFSAYIAEDLKETLRFLLATGDIPRGSVTKFDKTKDGYCFAQLTCIRLLFLIMVAMVRISIAFGLLISGSTWLCHQLNLEDLLLNCSALGFVLELDNIFFQVGAPMSIVGVLRKLEVIEMKWRCWYRFIPQGSLVFMICFTAAFHLEIEVQKDQMQKAEEALCKGWKNFAYGVGPISEMYIAEDNAYGEQLDISSTAKLKVVQSVIEVGEGGAAQADGLPTVRITPMSNLQNIILLSPSELIQNAECTDSDKAIGEWLYAVSGKSEFNVRNTTYTGTKITSCAEAAAANWCLMDSGDLGLNVRFMCPDACGCSNPKSGMYEFMSPNAGCPMPSCRQSTRWSQVLSATPCEDLSFEDLQAEPGWSTLKILLSSNSTDSLRAEKDDVMARGCIALNSSMSSISKESLCQMTDELGKSYGGALAAFCPKACGCSDDKAACPKLCGPPAPPGAPSAPSRI